MNGALSYWQAFVEELPEDDAMVKVLNGDLRRLVAKLAAMEDAILAHRFQVGEAYHNNSTRGIHAANTKLWRLVK